MCAVGKTLFGTNSRKCGVKVFLMCERLIRSELYDVSALDKVNWQSHYWYRGTRDGSDGSACVYELSTRSDLQVTQAVKSMSLHEGWQKHTHTQVWRVERWANIPKPPASSAAVNVSRELMTKCSAFSPTHTTNLWASTRLLSLGEHTRTREQIFNRKTSNQRDRCDD